MTQIKSEKKPDKGLLNLIQQKLELGIPAKEVTSMLKRAGFSDVDIHEAIAYAMRHDAAGHQKMVEDNDFLPPLKKTVATFDEKVTQVVDAVVHHRGLFKGRLRRKDFIVGMLFFFGLAFVFLSISVTWIEHLVPQFWQEVQFVLTQDTYETWLIFVPFIFAPITVMMLSLITRRLHNLGLPGWISTCYLLVFVSPFGDFSSPALLGMHIVLLVLFVLLLTKKGHPSPNRHGIHPPSTGSIFERVFGYERKHSSLHEK